VNAMKTTMTYSADNMSWLRSNMGAVSSRQWKLGNARRLRLFPLRVVSAA
jgi:hypothetical protein